MGSLRTLARERKQEPEEEHSKGKYEICTTGEYDGTQITLKSPYGDIETMIWDKPLTYEETRQVEEYLVKKYGLDVDDLILISVIMLINRKMR